MFLDRLGEEIVRFAGHRDLVGRVRLLHARRIERQHLHVEAGGIHFRDALVAHLQKPVVNPHAVRTACPQPLHELLAGPETNPGLTKCSSRAMVRMFVLGKVKANRLGFHTVSRPFMAKAIASNKS